MAPPDTMRVRVTGGCLPPLSIAPREDISATPAFITTAPALFKACGVMRRGDGAGHTSFAAAIDVPQGFICDKASISGLSVITPKRMERPAVCHDYLYRHGCAALLDGAAADGGALVVSAAGDGAEALLRAWLRDPSNGRKFADDIFLAHMRLCRTLTRFQAWRAHRAVRLFGAASYRNPAMAAWAADCAGKIAGGRAE